MNHFSCNNWAKGLNDTYIDNTSKDYPCLINIHKDNSCYLSEIGKYFDISSKFWPFCLDNELIQYQKKYFLNSIKKYDIKYHNLSKKNYFGYPTTNNNKYSIKKFGNTLSRGKMNLEEELFKNIIFMDLYLKNKTKYYPNEPKPEVYVQIKKGRGKIKIKVQKNETLIKEREKTRNYNNKSMFQNVIIMFFDTISRAHFFRKFPKTISFLNKLSRYETNFSKKKTRQFFSFLNIIALITYCEKTSLIFSNKKKAKNDIRWDHEGISISCIKGIYLGFFLSKMTSVIQKCLFGKQIFEYALEYLESFLETYLDYNKMFLFESGEGHEPTGQVVGYLDEIFYNFLFKLSSKIFLSNTTIIIFSDHGQHLNGPLYLFNVKDFLYERTLPLLFLIFPNTQKLYEGSLYKKIKNNQQVFITPYDIYYTLIHIALGNKFNKIKKN